MTTYLPSLPVIEGENKTYQYVPAGRSIISVITDDHAELATMAAGLVKVQMPTREGADRLTAATARHLCAERQYLYPVLEKSLPEQGSGIANRQIDRDETLLKDLRALQLWRPAPSRPYRVAPARQLWNKLTDALLGAADQIWDLATGRKTYPA